MIEIIGFLVHLYSDLHFDLESHGHMLFTMSDYLEHTFVHFRICHTSDPIRKQARSMTRIVYR